MFAPQSRRKVADFLQRLGLPGIVLLAALLCDLVIIGFASFDHIGPMGSDLFLLPGILALSACALWARTQPVAAMWTGAVTIVASTVVIRTAHASAYTALLPHISFAETVAGLELVFFCVRAANAAIAFVSTFALVSAALLAVLGRASIIGSSSSLTEAAVVGLVLLVVTVVVAVQLRKPVPRKAPSAVMSLVRRQWPLVGALTLALFFDTYVLMLFSSNIAGLLLLCTSAGAALAAVLAARYPLRAALALAGLMAVGALAMTGLGLGGPYYNLGGFTFTHVLAGMTVVVLLVRQERPGPVAGSIGLLSAVIAGGAVVNVTRNDVDAVRLLGVGALLLLGIAVAIGLYLRARDSERTRAVEVAVSDAQTAERMALARELHDVVAHHVTGIVVQAQAAKLLGAKDPHVITDALGQIENAGTEALAAMRRLVRSMRGDAPAGSSEFSEQATTDFVADLQRLVEAGNHGIPTELELDLPPGLPQEVSRSALRIVQESLTNVGKHATGASRAVVSAGVATGELHIRVSDDGAGASPPAGSGGYGLIGMRERVDLLRGRLSAGPGPDGGWLVEVWLPVDGEGEQ